MHAVVTCPKGAASTVDVNAVEEDIQLITVRKAAVERAAGLPKVCLTQTLTQIL